MIRGVWLDRRDCGKATNSIDATREWGRRNLGGRLAENRGGEGEKRPDIR